jgi:hypothetical protein
MLGVRADRNGLVISTPIRHDKAPRALWDRLACRISSGDETAYQRQREKLHRLKLAFPH